MVAFNLPQYATPLIGRSKELAELDAFIADPAVRLVTIIGPGGMGKTRLALAYLQRYLTDDSPFSDGVFFINLAPLSAADQIPTAVADALNFTLQGGDGRSAQEQIIDYLRQKKMLLLFDNFEHLLDGGKRVVDLLATARDLKVLVTSRERLNVHLEQLYPIEGLQFPDWETPEDAERYTAVQLFLQSARRVQPDFALRDSDDLTHLARICRMVAGMPLALEMAASWVDILPLAEIAAELQHALDFLETELRDLPQRHRSMRAAIDYSWQRLAEKEQEIFAGLSVFRGGFTREAARAVAGADLRQIGRLVSKSFLQYDQIDDRYRVHELMRQYGAEKLAGAEDVQTRHLNFFVDFAEDVSAGLWGPEPDAWVKRLRADMDNCRAALDWAVESGQAQAGLRLAAKLHGYWVALGNWREARQRLARLLALPEAAQHTLARANALHVAGNLACHMRDYEVGFALLRESKEIGLELGDAGKVYAGWALLAFGEFLHDKAAARQALEDGIAILREAGEPWQLWLGLNSRAWWAIESGDYQQAHVYFGEALAFARKKGHRWLSGITLSALGYLLYQEGDFGTAKAYLEESEAILRPLNDLRHRSLAVLGAIALLQGDYEQAVIYFEEQLTNYRQQGSRVYFARALSDLAIAAGHLGDHAQAAALLSQALPLAREASDPYDMAVCLIGAAGIQPQPRRAVQLLAAAQAAFEASGAIVVEPLYKAEFARIEKAARAALGEAAFDAAYAEGRTMPAEEAVASAIAGSHEWAEGSFAPLDRGEAAAEKPALESAEQERFVQEELLATGGFGEVYQGRDTSTGQVVIIKRLKDDLVAQQPDLLARFTQEGDLLRRLNHPNIVQMIAGQEINGRQCLVMEYVAGGTLRELLDKEKTLPLSRTLDIALELADALTRAHHLSVIHRDLKPGNVLLAEDGTPRLTDFGLARMIQREGEPLTQDGVMLGTIEYMSPEAFQGQELDASTDIWSFGVLLYEMLAGERPFKGDQIASIITAILNRPPPNLLSLRPDTPAALARLIEQMLVKEREDRIRRMRQVAAELDRIRDQLQSDG